MKNVLAAGLAGFALMIGLALAWYTLQRTPPAPAPPIKAMAPTDAVPSPVPPQALP